MPDVPATEHTLEQTEVTTDASRRTFVALGIGALGACYAGLIGYPVYQYLATPARKAVSSRGGDAGPSWMGQTNFRRVLP
jgi:hypothetical protein